MSNRYDCDTSWGRQRNSFAMPYERLGKSFKRRYNDRPYLGEELECNSYSTGCDCCECCNEGRWCNSGCGGTYNRVQLRGIQVQLQDNAIQTIEYGKNIIFNTKTSRQTPYITYDNTTGLITVRRSGIYHIEWWVATEGILVGTDTGITFSIITSEGHNIKASSPNTVGQVVGTAIIEIFASCRLPVTLRLVNETNGTVALAQVPVKANLEVFHVEY